MLMYVQVFVFLISLLLVSYLVLKKLTIVSLQLGLREFEWDFDTTAPPHNHYCADSGSKLSFLKDHSGHTEMLWLHFSIVEGSGDEPSIFLFFSVYGGNRFPEFTFRHLQ